MKKKVLLILLATILFFSLVIVNAQTVVQVQKDTPEKKSSWISFEFLKSPVFLGFFFFFIILVIIAIIIVVGVKYVVKYLKQRSDIFYRQRIERIKLASIHKSYQSKHWWHTDKNTPIRLVKVDFEGKPRITQPIGYHRGDFTSHEGNVIISMNLVGKKKLWIFPVTDLLIIPNKEKIKFIQHDKEGKRTRESFVDMPMAKDILAFHDNEILLYAEGVSNSGIFYIPVLKTPDGKIIDLAMPTFQSLKEVVVEDYLYLQTQSFVDVARKSIDLNPNLRYAQKVRDPDQNVEMPTGGMN